MIRRRAPANHNDVTAFCDSLVRRWNFKTSLDLFRLNRSVAVSPQLLGFSTLPSFKSTPRKCPLFPEMAVTCLEL